MSDRCPRLRGRVHTRTALGCRTAPDLVTDRVLHLPVCEEYGLSSRSGLSFFYFRKPLDELKKIGFVLQDSQLEIVLEFYSTKKPESRSVAPRRRGLGLEPRRHSIEQ